MFTGAPLARDGPDGSNEVADADAGDCRYYGDA